MILFWKRSIIFTFTLTFLHSVSAQVTGFCARNTVVLCQNNGKCNDVYANGVPINYSCTCQPGFTGRNCELSTSPAQVQRNLCSDAKPCGNYPCYWIHEWSAYMCDCINGQFAINKTCTTEAQLCLSNVCLNDGTCLVTGYNTFSCACPVGYTGRYCETRIVIADPCSLANPCLNSGTCRANGTNYTCVCSPEYTGERCENTIYFNPCKLTANGCQNGGTCFPSQTSYICICPTNFTGERCEVPIYGCNSNNCANGVCMNINGLSLCKCNTGWSGQSCNTQTAVTGFCTKNTVVLCQNNGKCNDVYTNGVLTNYTCTCPPGFTGTNCQLSTSSTSTTYPLSQCQSCINGRCILPLVGQSAYCKCYNGWTGNACNQKIVCDTYTRCFNGGVCSVNGTRCICANYYKGERCERIDASIAPRCTTNICSNGGTCYQTDNKLNCACAGFFYGQYCQFV